MKSPFTGGNVTKLSKDEAYTFRNEKYIVKRYYFQCDETGKTFTNAEVDNLVMEDLYNQYRQRHGIPSPSELKNLREKYGLSAHTMSKIAGIGINQYGLYENGEMPTPVIGKSLASLFDKNSLLKQIDNSCAKLGKDYPKVRNKVASYIEPRVFSLKKDFYYQFSEMAHLSAHSTSYPYKKARWTTC